jgi:hypothetical protein
LKGSGATWACGPRAEEVAGDLGPLRPGKKKEGERKTLTRGPGLAERKGEGGGKGAGPRVAHAGERRRKGPEGGKRERSGPAEIELGWFLSILLFLFLFYTQTIQNNSIWIQINLNSNPTQIKQCTSMNAQTCCSYIKFYFLVL